MSWIACAARTTTRWCRSSPRTSSRSTRRRYSQQLTPNAVTYTPDTDFTTMQYSGAGDIPSAQLVATNDIVIPPTPVPSSSSGCEATDFPANTTGSIVLIQRGTCTFEQKAQNAAAAGAVGVVIFNEGNPGRTDLLSGTLTNVQPIPVVGTTFALGNELYALVQAGTVTMHLKVDVTTTPIKTWNVLAEKKGRVKTQDVVVGAHLDSVDAGPGINDNGSGTATILTIAEQFTNLHIRPRNTVRFAFWGAEEEGLVGSTHYVDNCRRRRSPKSPSTSTSTCSARRISCASSMTATARLAMAGPPGSEVIEEVFTDFFDRRGLASEPTPFDGRSDYFAFIDAGIPAGGLFSGAEGIKTPAQQAEYGGTAGEAYDPCYHQACDDIDNLSRRALNQLGKAAAHAVLPLRHDAGERSSAGRDGSRECTEGGCQRRRLSRPAPHPLMPAGVRFKTERRALARRFLVRIVKLYSFSTSSAGSDWSCM